ncbi:uncharacterized protein [Asterias amurensis]|uniref:uncharacterized protein n=1 Tax=Asterias amurensis TaxID=7602 RepID=UPI003AB79C3B
MERPTVIIGTLLLVLMLRTCHVNAQIDYISPYFTFCPTEVTTYAENGGTTATVDWTLPTVTDDSGVPPQVTSTYDPNSVFSVGNTFVTYTASDESGNVASCFFVVSVIQCSLTISSCSNGGTLDPDFCECVCPEDYTGETCEAPNPCLETPSLCTTEIGKYCVPDDSVAGYACQCRDYDGFIANSDGSCTETPTLKIGGVTINLPFTSGLTNQQSSAYKEMASKFVTEMTRLFGSKEATRSFLSLSVLSFSEGSVVAEMSASFPSGSTLPRITDIMDALAEGTISDGSTDYPIDSSALVIEGTGGADTTIPVISGCPSGASGVLSTQGASSAVVSWVEPTATDNDGQVVDVSRSHAPSTTFSAGSTTVTYVFTDTAGNVAICSFDVDVTPDYISPFFTFCPTEITTYAENGGTTATVDWTLPTVTDNSGVTPEVTSTYDPNSVFSVGNTFVIYTASDESGNVASCFFVVSVIQCSLTISSCSNGGTLDPDFCECVCPEDYTGETCETPNPCLETPSLCTTEIGKYCVSDDSVAGYACQCRDYDGFIANSDGSCSETPTLKIGGVTINLPFTSGLTNQQSSAFKEMASKFVTEMTRLFGSKEATRSFLSLSVLSFSEGSVVAEMSASFPSGSTLPKITDIMDALAEGTISDGSTDYPIDLSALVIEGTGGADTTIPVISGCPSGASGVLSTQGAIVSWVEPTATDNDGQVVDVSRSHAPSTTFSAGSTTVTYVFTDTAGNVAICSFDVDVTPDYISPFFTFCPTEITTYAENGGTTATVDWTLPTVTDNSGVTPEVTSTYDPNSVFSVGNTFVIYTASDESGNVASCFFVVSVIQCSLTISSCSNGGTLDPDFCECVCPEDYTGETCEAPNPCLETPSLCTTEIGKYCVPDDSVAGYACQCRDYDGFIANSDGSCTETPTLKIGGVTINLTFTSGLTNQQSSAFKEMASKFITEMTRLFGSKEATRSFLSLSVLSFSEGSVVAEMSASFPSGSTLPRITDIMDALAEGTISDGSTDYPIDSSALVVEGTGGADTTIPVISGCPSGASGVLSAQGAVVSWVEPTATDNDGQVVDVSRSHAPSTTFSAGSTTVTYVFTDTAGNEAICSFDVDVTPDYISPFFTFCPTEITTYAENGGTTATVDWTLPTVTDNSGVTPEVTSTYDPNSVFSVGNTFVIYTASDESGNVASCFFVVSVIQCSLTISSCSNGGTLDPDFCECVCPEDYTGETCEAPNPCLETPSLCTTEIGKYCVPDDSVAGYACQCRDYDGFIANSDGSCTETPTLKIGGVTINLTFTSGLTNQQSSAFKEMASKFITEMTRLFGSKEATRSFLSLSVLSFSEGSVVAEMSASFPSGSTLPRITDIMDALAEGTISDGSTDYPIDSSALVVEGTGGADTTIPVISGCPSGASGVLSAQGAVVSWVEPTATDNDGQVVDVSRSHAPSTTFSAGSTTVTYVFTDTAGNEAICSFDVDVTPDYISPFFTFCPTEITTYAENGGTTATVDWTLPTVTDNSGVTPEVTSTYDPNSVFSVGNTFVIYTASDESGNVASCFFVVSVIQCSLTISSCSNGGTLDPDFCECVCPEDYTGETCEAPNPCLETPSLCTTEIGKYCVPDDSVAGYACQCRDYDGFIANSDGSCTETPTLKIGGVTINLPFTSGLTNQQSSAFKEMASKFITEMTRLFGSKEATRSFLSLSVLSFSEGSVVAEMSASFPSGSTLPRITDIMDALAEGTISDGSTDYPIDSSALVIEGTGGADTTIPVISGCPSGASGVLSAQGAIVSWVEPTATDNDGQVVDVSRSHAPSTTFSAGSTTVTYVFTDTAGNVAICSFVVDVTPDFVNPVFSSCPSDITTSAQSGGTATVDWTVPTATDNSGVTPQLTSNHYPNSVFNLGTTSVQYTASDGSDNSASCFFDVNVIDINGPTVTCPSDESFTNVASGVNNAQIVWSASPSASDIVDGAIGANAITCEDGNSMTVMSGDRYKIGITTVTCTASDSAMNQGSCQFDITVECSISASDCSNGGAFDNDFCECLCLADYSGETCDDFNPCLLDTSLCTMEIGKYCVPDDSVAGYACQCRDYDGFIANSDGSCTETPTLKIGGLKIDEQFTPALENRRSRAFQDLSSTFINGMKSIFSGSPATASVSSLSVLSFSEGSVIAAMSASFPINSSVPNVTNIMDAVASGSSNFSVDASSLIVEDIDSCKISPCLNGGTCNNTIANFTCTCAPGFGGETCEIDIEAPIVCCPSNASFVNVDAGTAFANVTWSSLPSASDNVDVNITDSVVCEDDLGNVVISGRAYTAGLTTVTCKAHDTALNEGSCQFNITVVDDEAPVITCPDNLASVEVAIGMNQAAVVWSPLPSANDTVDGILASDRIICVDDSGNQVASGVDFGIGLTTIICTAQDAASNEATCDFNITTECLLSAVNCSNGGTFSADFCECLCPLNYTGDTCEVDRPPTFNSCPSNMFVNTTLNEDFAVVTWPVPMAVDDNGSPIVVEQNGYNTGRRFNIGQWMVMYVATDSIGQTASCDFSVTITDNEMPVIQNCPTNITRVTTAGSMVAVSWNPPSSSDNSGEYSMTVNDNHVSGDTFALGVYNVIYTAMDPSGNAETCVFVITIEEDMPPVFSSCPRSTTVRTKIGEAFAIVGFSNPGPTDDRSTPVLLGSHAPGSQFPLGDTEVVYTAYDSAGQSTECVFVITVEVDEPPTFNSCPSNMFVNTTLNEDFAVVTWPVPMAVDDNGSPIVVEQNGYNTGRRFNIGQWMVMYVATDFIGQTASCDFSVTVTDNEKPVFQNCPTDITRVTTAGSMVAVSWNPPSSSDNSGEYSMTVNDNHVSGDTFAIGVYNVIYTAMDPSGNADTCVFVITIEEDMPPMFSSCPRSTTVKTDPGEAFATVSFSYPGPTDDRSNPVLMGSHAPGTQFPLGDTQVVYTAYDSAGQSTECVFVITVEDRGDPIIMNCPSGITIYVLSASSEAAAFWTLPTANDTSAVTLSSNKDPGDLFGSGTTKVTYTATDAADNEDSCSFSVTVQETNPTYETDGTVELVRIANTSSSSFTQNFVDAAIDDLIADLDKLFRLSSAAANFIGITLDTASLSNDNKATVKFIISFIGSPPPNDTDIVNAFTSSLTGVSANEFDTGNAVTVGSFLLSQQDCRQIPCQNDGTCALQGSSYTCSCTASWSGETCEQDVDECLTAPCALDRVCINTLGSYICGCASGFFLVGDSCISVSQFSGSFAITRIGAQTAVFSAALDDASSQEYQSVVSDVTAVLDGIFSTEPSFIESQVLGMSSGSIMVEYLLIFASDTELNQDAVTKQMSASVSGDGEMANSDIYIRPSSLTVAIEICPSGFCKNSGTCSPDPVTYESTCTCSSPYSGDRCEITNVWSPIVIAMVATAGVLSIVLIALFFACCFFLGKRLDEKEPKYPGNYDIEQRDSYISSLPSKKQSRSSNAPPSQPSGRRIQTSFAASVDLDAGSYRRNTDDLADVSFVNHVFDIQDDESTQQVTCLYSLRQQSLGYTDDVPRDYPMVTFMHPYIATGHEASKQVNAAQGRRLNVDADYF